jgi:hypothetical protein
MKQEDENKPSEGPKHPGQEKNVIQDKADSSYTDIKTSNKIKLIDVIVQQSEMKRHMAIKIKQFTGWENK